MGYNLAKISMKKHMLLTILILSIVSILLSCKKSDNSSGSSSGGGSSNPQYGNVTFWINESASQITVSFYGGDKKITKYYPAYNPTCGSSGCANYTDIPVGSYYFSARNSYGTYTWSGYVNVQTGCNLFLLSFKKDSHESELIDDEYVLIKADEYSDEDFE